MQQNQRCRLLHSKNSSSFSKLGDYITHNARLIADSSVGDSNVLC